MESDGMCKHERGTKRNETATSSLRYIATNQLNLKTLRGFANECTNQQIIVICLRVLVLRISVKERLSISL